MMGGNGKAVILCRGLSEKNDTPKAYVETLESAGYICECLRTLRFEFVNISELRACLSRVDEYSGNILSVRKTLVSFMCLHLVNSYCRSDTNQSPDDRSYRTGG